MRGAKILVAATALLLAGCGGPRIIPDRELARIFHDIYLVNGYVNQAGVATDSLNIYEPVFDSHGYTGEDVQFTIGNFAKRKSTRLSSVVEEAVGMLRAEGGKYRRRMEIRDTVALVARLRYADTVLRRDRIAVRRTADTSRLRIVVGDVKPGSYNVSWGYVVDSLDRNLSLHSDVWLVDSAGRRSGNQMRRLDREEHGKGEAGFTTNDVHRRLVISLGGYPDDMTTPHITIDSLTVIRYLPDEEAVRRLKRSWYGSGSWLIDSLIVPAEAEHSTPGSNEKSIVTPRLDTPRPRIR